MYDENVSDLTTEVSRFIAFIERLLIKPISANREIGELEYRLDKLAERLSMGEISEETYKKATKRLEEKIMKLKQAKKAK